MNQENARTHISAAFVNGFVNCGFGVDKILDDTETANRFFFKNHDVGVMTSVASLGLIHRWDIEYGLGQCDRFLYSNDDYVRAGTLLAIGIICAGVQDPCDPASALLMDHINSERHCMRIGSTFGLGLAYANSKRETVTKKEEGGVIFELKKVLDSNDILADSQVKGIASLSLGLILVGTGDQEAANVMFTLLMEQSEEELSDHYWSFVGLGIGLIFLGRLTSLVRKVLDDVCFKEPNNAAKYLLKVCDPCHNPSEAWLQHSLMSVLTPVLEMSSKFKIFFTFAPNIMNKKIGATRKRERKSQRKRIRTKRSTSPSNKLLPFWVLD